MSATPSAFASVSCVVVVAVCVVDVPVVAVAVSVHAPFRSCGTPVVALYVAVGKLSTTGTAAPSTSDAAPAIVCVCVIVVLFGHVSVADTLRSCAPFVFTSRTTSICARRRVHVHRHRLTGRFV